jgi:hypothetical protein
MAKVKRFGQGGSSSDPKRYIKRGPNGAQPASKPPVYQKEVAVRKTSEVSSPNSKGVSSSAKSTSIRPKVYEGEVSGSVPKSASGKSSGNVYEGERVSKPITRAGSASEGAASRLSNAVSKGLSSATSGSRALSALSKAAPIVGRGAAGLAATPVQIAAGALMPSDLEKDETPYKGSKDSYTATSAKDRAAELMGQPKAKASTPDVEIKASASKTPAASKPALKSGTSKPKGPTEGDRARAAIESMRSQYESGDLYNKVGLEKSAEDENARTKTEATEASEYKKGGMTKRPPKPAKKVPPRKFASGGNVSRTSASKRGDGCATKGHTKGKYL